MTEAMTKPSRKRKPKPEQASSIDLPEIERVPIETLSPYWRNARKNDAAVPAVKESITRYGLNQPLVVDEKGVIIVGHTRYRALLELGATTVPVVRPKLSAALAKEYRIADNKTGEIADWDKDALIPELRAMGDAGTIMAPFFVERDLARLLRDSVGVDFVPVTSEKVDAILDKQDDAFNARTRPDVGAKIRLECPHCGEDFHVDRDIIQNHPGDRT